MPGYIDTGVVAHLAFAFQLSLGVVFLLSALPKLGQPLAFARSVAEYRILPPKVAHAFAMTLIPLEAFLAITFLTGWVTSIALPLAAVTLIAFLVAVGTNLKRGRRVPCGCFGDGSEQISPRTLARLSLLLIVVLFLIAFRSTGDTSSPDLPSMTADAPSLAYLLQAAVLAAFLILLASWMLSLPEAILMIRHVRWGRPSSSTLQESAEVEGA